MFLLVMTTMTSRSFSAPSLKVPASSVVSVEHPCNIKSTVQRAVDTLGGPELLSKVS